MMTHRMTQLFMMAQLWISELVSHLILKIFSKLPQLELERCAHVRLSTNNII